MANYVYPAIFTPEENGFSILFPDLEGCYTSGNDLSDGMKMAEDVLALTLTFYEDEQKKIDKTISDLKANLAKTTRESEELRYLFDKLRDLSQVTELDPTLVNTLIKRIEVHNSEKRDGKNYVKVDIYFTAIGMFDIPSDQRIEKCIITADTVRKLSGPKLEINENKPLEKETEENPIKKKKAGKKTA